MTRYIEELSLWGANSFLFWFETVSYDSFNDPKAQAMIVRLRTLLKTVKSLGLDTSLGCVANAGYKNSPMGLRADSNTEGHRGYHVNMGKQIFNFGPELCASKPGVLEMELGYCQEKFDAFRDIGLDYWFIWPYDNGGCTCPKCAPWGSNGYLRLAEPLARAYHRAFPQGKVILSAWSFDRWAIGEWEGIAARFSAQKPDWAQYLMADNVDEYPRYPLEHSIPGGLPLLNFPEISMWGQFPWGGYGANPQVDRIQARWDQSKRKLSGGFSYSEGIFEDLNKVAYLQLYWQPDRPALETVKEYVAFEFSPQVVGDVTSAVRILETNHHRDNIQQSAVRAFQLLEQADAKLSSQARCAWRWRILYLRGLIDREMYRNRLGQAKAEVLQQAIAELTKIYHAENAYGAMRRRRFPWPARRGHDRLPCESE